ncbi:MULTISPECIES: ribonuclease J [unclassified Candidatus Frackibacter]|uniref:ribonuclease J n=1 Tax=unclassified Candidatus Frackibacter TaxID=2648818 RepID=UPI0007929EEE|nr:MULTISPECIES: ribonuclease J [unclassified Candidatus Frackibacter]KXS44499.1 MAG: RNA-metabolising metallo-beta-lactamase [Candidatus Frackibacter sp. T328-2]SDC66032.1 ribonuclease J [Candidatus Frackibacter sp. WG11]SEM79167.1 ribonuclease J [Candidatus Frackibacter sp. WG12]SFL89944.1 ribonuclease J [Candidatus Frackibacter sp. WG13]
MTKKDRIGIIQLGGKGVVGNNLIVIEYKEDILILDAGVMFPTDEMLGIDLVIPDMTYLKENKERVKALLLSHGHEDHIGGIPYLISDINIPIYGTQLTISFVKDRLKDRNLLKNTELNIIKPRDKVELGSFKAQFINVNHSIPDAVAISLETDIGKILYTGDFKIDFTPIDNKPTDFYKLAEIGEEGLLALLSDSTNAERNGYTGSESTIGKTLEDRFTEAEGRVIVATFSSHIHRIQQAITAAKMTNRKIAVTGRSMINSVQTAQELGYVDLTSDMLVDIRSINKLEPEELVILMTGSQGEPMAALTRVARGDHHQIQVNNTDTVFISATPIPGNELSVSNTINQLLEKGVQVIYGNEFDVHVSGHAAKEELKLMLALTKPNYFIPVHGEYRHLYHHAEVAKEIGISEENIFITPNGVKLEINSNEAKITDKVPAGKVFVDGLGVGDIGNVVLNDRQALADDGMIIIMITIDGKTGEVVAGPDIISRGFIHIQTSQELIAKIKKRVKKALEKTEAANVTEWSKLKSKIKYVVNDFLYHELKRNPMILPLIMEV